MSILDILLCVRTYLGDDVGFAILMKIISFCIWQATA